MDLVAQLAVNTLQIGAVYVLFSLGLTIVFGVMKVVNFAHGEFFTFAALLVAVLSQGLGVAIGLPAWLIYLFSLVAAVAAVVALGLVVYRFGFARYLRDLVGSFILSIGLLLLMQGLFLEIFTGVPRVVPPITEATVSILGGRITLQRLVISLGALAITGVTYLVIKRSRLGKALRAVAEDHEAAMLQGIDYRRIAFVGFLIGSALAALAGSLIAPLTVVSPVVGGDYLIKSFIIIIVGGLGSIPGAIIAGFLLAFLESVGGYYFDPLTATIAMFVLVIVFLVARPQGIMGHVER